MSNTETQEQIASWFDRTYSVRGDMYLRPVRAYRIFPVLLGMEQGESVLDVACGLGRMLEAAKEYNTNLTGVDISKVAVQKAKRMLPNATIVEGNAEELPFKDGEFDYVTCLGSLERMLDLDKVLGEILRVGNQTARFCFLVRNSLGLTWKLKRGLGIINKKGHQGAKTLEEWEDVFASAGFKPVATYADQYPIKKREIITSLGLKKIDYKSVSQPWLPFRNVHEYIFILEKAQANIY